MAGKDRNFNCTFLSILSRFTNVNDAEFAINPMRKYLFRLTLARKRARKAGPNSGSESFDIFWLTKVIRYCPGIRNVSGPIGALTQGANGRIGTFGLLSVRV